MSGSRSSLEEWVRHCERGLGLVFADIVSSTFVLYEVGTTSYTELRRMSFDRAEEIASQYDGRLINSTGDVLFYAFPSATSAFGFAGRFFWSGGGDNLRVRVGVHFGTATADGDDLLGRDVHFAARVMQHGLGAELWLSQSAKNALEAESPDVASGIRWLKNEECELHGVPDKHWLWRAA